MQQQMQYADCQHCRQTQPRPAGARRLARSRTPRTGAWVISTTRLITARKYKYKIQNILVTRAAANRWAAAAAHAVPAALLCRKSPWKNSGPTRLSLVYRQTLTESLNQIKSNQMHFSCMSQTHNKIIGGRHISRNWAPSALSDAQLTRCFTSPARRHRGATTVSRGTAIY
jgi:hypothetical protein